MQGVRSSLLYMHLIMVPGAGSVVPGRSLIRLLLAQCTSDLKFEVLRVESTSDMNYVAWEICNSLARLYEYLISQAIECPSQSVQVTNTFVKNLWRSFMRVPCAK